MASTAIFIVGYSESPIRDHRRPLVGLLLCRADGSVIPGGRRLSSLSRAEGDGCCFGPRAALGSRERRNQMKVLLTTVAVAALSLSALSAFAAGPYDGTWTFEAPAVAGGSGDPYDLNSCAAVRFQVQVQDSRVVGNLRMTPYAGGSDVSGNVSSSPGRGSSPVTGTVAPDGTVNAQWQTFKATGNLGSSPAKLSWRGACGPRTATGQRSS